MLLKGSCHCGAVRFSVYSHHPYPFMRCYCSICRHCGSFLWVYDPEYPDLMHPFASAIDTELPKPPEHTHIMLDFAASWVEVPTTNLYYFNKTHLNLILFSLTCHK